MRSTLRDTADGLAIWMKLRSGLHVASMTRRIKEITDTCVHYGYRHVHVMLRREGHADNVKRVHRLYCAEGLSLRLKRPRRNKAAKLRQPKQIAFAINEVWSMDFVADALFDGRKLCMLMVVDCYTRECLAIEVGQSLKGEDCQASTKQWGGIGALSAYPRDGPRYCQSGDASAADA